MVGRIFATNSNKQEDKQTASVFSSLLHLPDDEFWNILRDSCYGNSLPETSGKIEFYEFWPHWPPDIDHVNYVEPDLFIRFEDFDVIIEAKRKDEYQQIEEQWNSEFSSYLIKYGLDNKKVYLLAVGGLNPINLSPENRKNIFVQKCRWRGLLDTLYSYLEKYENNNFVRIINDCIEYLEYFKFKKIKWLKEMDAVNYYKLNNNSINEAIKWRII